MIRLSWRAVKRSHLLWLLPAVAVVMAATCDAISPKDYGHYSSASGLLVGGGDVDEGRVTFLKLHCNSCHTLHLISLPMPPSPLSKRVELGGEVDELPSDGYLATAIINPSHDLAKGYKREVVTESGASRMSDYEDLLTIRDLKNLVAFLHTQYRLAEEEH
jgi:sulfur-oxidizing protein SoxX